MKDLNSIDWAEAFARLHPVLLHLPVGLLVALAWLQCWQFFKRSRKEAHPARAALVWLLVLSTPLAAAAGWLLHEGASYPYPIDLHEWFGIGLATVSVLIWVAHLKRSKHYATFLWIGCLLLFPTAHFGGTLTHGEGFLTEPFFETEESAAVAPAASAVSYADVLPILEARCSRCHGERKQRGGLAVTTLDALLAGGDSGPAIVLGNPAESLLLARLQLPLDHDEHMPPSNKTQPTENELRWIEAWVGGQSAPSEAAIEPVPEVDPPEPEKTSVLETEQAAVAIEALRARLAHVQPTALDAETLWVDFTASTLGEGDLVKLLGPLSEAIVELSLAGKSVPSGDLAYLATLPQLDSLDLRRLAQEELDLEPLTKSRSIRTLNLAGTKIKPASAPSLAQMKQLERVFVWGTGLDSPALASQRPELVIVGASPPPDQPLEVEPEVQFEQAPEPDVLASPTAAENSTCPVTQQPVDSRYVVLFEGRAIGFCCPNCPKTFWNDPQAFLSKLGKK